VPKPTIIVHGGAGAIQPAVWREYKRNSQLAAQHGQALLDTGAHALDAAIAATVFMEDNHTFNAGTGSCLNRDGVVECDAFVMRDDRTTGAVASVSGVRNPVRLARIVLEQTPHNLVVGAGALLLAQMHGIELCDPQEMVIPRRRLRWEELKARGMTFEQEINPEEAHDDPVAGGGEDGSDTVGACALDGEGHLAVASSTGGIMMKMPGRVGDCPIVGAGNYCGPAGAAACTGHGEAAMRVCLAKYVYDLLELGASAAEAAERGIDHAVNAVNGFTGVVVADARGNRGWCTSTHRIAVGVPELIIDANAGGIPAGEPAAL
jgi:beta-aspartyl-peptidase (threonine type)